MDNCLITGGTGTFGVSYICKTIENGWHQRVVSYSRDELKQIKVFKFLQKRYGRKVKKSNEPVALDIGNVSVRFVVGDVLDFDRLMVAMRGVDLVVHAAALKHVPVCEYNPIEATKINIEGSVNVVRAAGLSGVDEAIALSTDKAVDPINIYGATKLCLERLFLGGNAYFHDSTKFRVVRYGNIMGSRGSIIHLLNNSRESVELTNPDMTRFWLSIEDAIDLVRHAELASVGGEIFVPVLKSLKMGDLFDCLRPKMKIKVVGSRAGEKIHEKMISEYDLNRTKKIRCNFVDGVRDVYVITSAQNEYHYSDKSPCELKEYTSDVTEKFSRGDFVAKLNSSIIKDIYAIY